MPALLPPPCSWAPAPQIVIRSYYLHGRCAHPRHTTTRERITVDDPDMRQLMSRWGCSTQAADFAALLPQIAGTKFGALWFEHLKFDDVVQFFDAHDIDDTYRRQMMRAQWLTWERYVMDGSWRQIGLHNASLIFCLIAYVAGGYLEATHERARFFRIAVQLPNEIRVVLAGHTGRGPLQNHPVIDSEIFKISRELNGLAAPRTPYI